MNEVEKKEIEEMARTNCGRTYKNCYDCVEDSKKILSCVKLKDCEAYSFAKALHSAGYRKLPADSVVLSREEYELLKAENDKYVKNCIDYIAAINKLENKVWEVEQQACKETAEKILNYLELSGIDTALFNTKIRPYIESMYGINAS